MRPPRSASPTSEIAFWAVVFALVSGAVLGLYAPAFEAQVGLPVVDVDGASRPERTLALMARYGHAGRSDYLAFLSLDCLLPVAGSLLLLALYDATTRSWRLPRLARRTLVMVGALPALADLLENTLYALLAALYPRHAEPLAQLAYLATLAKLATGSVSMLVLGVLAAVWLRRRAPAPLPHEERLG